MLAVLLVVLRTLGLICSGHRAVALETVALRQQLAVFRRTVRRPQLRTRDRLFWVLLAKAWPKWRTAWSWYSLTPWCVGIVNGSVAIGPSDQCSDGPAARAQRERFERSSTRWTPRIPSGEPRGSTASSSS